MAFVHRQLSNGSRDVSLDVAVKDDVLHKPNGFSNGGRKHRHDDEEQGKMFVGGLSWDTSQDSLLGYFSRFGEVIDCVVMRNAETGRSRRFGFVTFSDPSVVDNVLASCPHSLDGRTIDPKSCNPRSMQKPKRVAALPKVFLGGLPTGITESDLAGFFSRYGDVCEVVIMYDQEKKKSRGFGFLSFAEDNACARAVAEHYVFIQNKKVEIKRAEPRSHNVCWNGDQKTVHWVNNDSSGNSQQESQPPIQILPSGTNAFWGQPALHGAPTVARAMPPPFAPPLHSQPPPSPFGAPTPLAHPPPSVTPQQRGPIACATPVSASVQHWTAQPPPVWTVPTSTYATPPPTMASYNSLAAAVAAQPPPQFWPPHQPPPPMLGHPYQGKVFPGGAAAYTSPPTPVTVFSSAASVYPYQQQQLCSPTVQVLNPVPVMAVPQHQAPPVAKTPYAEDQERYNSQQQHMLSTAVQAGHANGGSGAQRMAVYAQPSSQVQSYHPYRRSWNRKKQIFAAKRVRSSSPSLNNLYLPLVN